MTSTSLSISLLAGTIATLVAATEVVAQQTYPNRPIRLITAQAAGGSGDTVTRLTGSFLSERLGNPVVVENKPGGAFIIGVDAVAKAAPDGYTLLSTNLNGIDILPSPEKLPYNAEKDFVAVAMVAMADAMIVISPKLGIKTLKELIALAKANPGKMTFASSGPASVTGFDGELFKLRTGMDILHVPFKGGAQYLTEVTAGRIDIGISGAVAAPHVRSGNVIALMLLGPKRVSILPEVPTGIELGYPDLVGGSWYGVLAPTGTPQAIVQRLAKELEEVSKNPKFAEAHTRLGNYVRYEGSEQFAKTIAAERKFKKAIAKEANIKFE
jgi:tripartite-type tricarboxylate transporter receptor subunit TctC